MFLKKVIKFLIYLSLFLPLVFVNYTMYPWHFGKTLYFQILIDVLAVLAVAFFAFKKKDFQFKKPVLLDWLILAFLGSMLLSAIFGLDFNRSFWGNQQRVEGVFTWVHFVIFYFLLRQFFTTKKDWMNLGFIVVVVAFISGVVAWVGQNTPLFEGKIEEGGRLMGIIGNPIFFANYLTIPIFLSFFWFLWFLSQKNKEFILGKKPLFISWLKGKQVWFYLLAGIFFLITFLASGVRGAFVGFLFGLFIMWLLLLFGRVLEKKARNIFAFLGILGALVFLGVYTLAQSSDIVSNISPKVQRLLSLNLEDTTAKTRIMAWRVAVLGWKDYPIFGSGPENYQYIFDKYYNPDFLEYSFAETVWDKPHNYFLEILSAQGILGALLYLAIIISVIFYLFRILKREDDKYNKLAIILLFGGLSAYVVQNLFAFETSNSLQLWFLLLAFVVFLYKNSFSEDFLKESETSRKKELILRVVFVVVLVLAVFSINKNYIMLKSSYYMSLARDAHAIDSNYYWEKYANEAIKIDAPFVWENAIFLTKDLAEIDGNGLLNADVLKDDGTDSDGVAFRIEKVFLDVIKRNPDAYLYHFWISQLYTFMGEYLDNKYYLESEKHLKAAGEASPKRQNVPLLLSKNYLLQGKPDEAIKVLEGLVAQNEKYEEPHWFLGLAYIGNGEREKGIEEMEKGGGLVFASTGNTLYMINLYLEDEKYKKTIPLYEYLISVNPDNADFYHDVAIMYLVTGDIEKSVENFNIALRLKPELKDRVVKFLKSRGENIDILNQ